MGASVLLAAMAVACEAGHRPVPVAPFPPLGPGLGNVEVTTMTSGAVLPADGYVVRVDGEWDYEYEPTKVPTNGKVTLSNLTAGNHGLTLLGVPANCGGESLENRPIVVSSGAVTVVVFSVVCSDAVWNYDISPR